MNERRKTTGEECRFLQLAGYCSLEIRHQKIQVIWVQMENMFFEVAKRNEPTIAQPTINSHNI